LDSAGISEPQRRSIKEAAARKDVARIEEHLHEAGVRGPLSKALLAVPTLLGREEILDTAERLVPRHELCGRALSQLRAVWDKVHAADLSNHLLIDMGEVRSMEYYTGLVFDIYADGIGTEIGGGGRYDHLISRFGREAPSTGFAFNLDCLLELYAKISDGARRVNDYSGSKGGR
jgi:ATP phosphoribosyltransferase regulatory subunit